MNHQYSKWITDRIQWHSLASFSLFLLVIINMTNGVSYSAKGLNLLSFLPIALSALILSWALAVRKLRKLFAFIFLTIIGVFIVFTTIGRLWDAWADLWKWLSHYFFSLYQSFTQDSSPPTTGTIYNFSYTLGDNLLKLFDRLVSWFRNFPNPSHDVFASTLVWGIGVWSVSVWGAWKMHFGKKILVGIAPALFLMGLSHSLSDTSPNAILPSLGAILALMILIAFTKQEQGWTSKGIGYSHIISKNTKKTAFFLPVIIIFTASLISSIDIQTIINRLNELDPPPTNESQTAQQPGNSSSLTDLFSKIESGKFPNSHLLGSDPELSEEVVMLVKVNESETDFNTDISDPHPTYYFSSIVYDTYDLHGWTSEVNKIYTYEANKNAVKKYTSNQRLIQQSVQFLNQPGGLIYSVGELVVVNKQYSVAWKDVIGGEEFIDMVGAKIYYRSYEAQSMIPFFNESELRNSKSIYPDWIVNRYLQIPENLPDRVYLLAQDITATASTPYDKAVAIEQYLRTFPYSLTLPPQPENIDLVDYFLFDLQLGYCDYFASSMVILARAVGLPARFVVGYIGETYDETNDNYVIYGDQAHSWVEIYFPDYGWVTFEPTAGRPPLERLESRKIPPEMEEILIEEIVEPKKLTLPDIVFKKILPYFILLSILGIIALPKVDIWILNRQTAVRVYSKIYQRLQRFGRYLGIKINNSNTPREFSIDLLNHLIETGKNRPFKAFMNSVPRDVNLVIDQTIHVAYSPNPVRSIQKAGVVKSWRRLRWQLLIAAIFEKLSSQNFFLRRKQKE